MFKLFSRIPLVFFAPDNPSSSGNTGVAGGTPTPQGKEDVIEFLGMDDEPEILPLEDKAGKGKEKPKETPKEDERTEEVSEGDEEEVDELAEIEDELKEPTEEQLELVTPVRRKEILAKYPNLFKEFPYLERAYYREQAFTEILPTIQDAKVAVEKAQTLDKFETDLLGGNTEGILKAVKEENPKGFNKLVDDYLPTLARVDEKAYFHLLGNISKHTIVAMVQEGKRSGNEALTSAAQILNQFVFGTSNFSPPSNLSNESPEKEQKETETNQREQQFLKQQFDTVSSDLNTRVNNTLKNTIDAHIDPKNSMNDYVRKNASKDALETLEDLMSKDARFKSITDKLWEKAFEENFSKTSMDRIRSAFLSKAKTLLPSVIKKARNEALKGSGKRVANGEEETTSNRGPVNSGRPRSQTPSGKIRDAKDIPKGMRSIDFLMQD